MSATEPSDGATESIKYFSHWNFLFYYSVEIFFIFHWFGSFWYHFVSFWYHFGVILVSFGTIVAIKNRVKWSIFHANSHKKKLLRWNFSDFQWFFLSFFTVFDCFSLKNVKNISRVKWSIFHANFRNKKLLQWNFNDCFISLRYFSLMWVIFDWLCVPDDD